MAEKISPQTKLNPQAEEFQPVESLVVCRPHKPPQINELVVYQPPPLQVSIPYYYHMTPYYLSNTHEPIYNYQPEQVPQDPYFKVHNIQCLNNIQPHYHLLPPPANESCFEMKKACFKKGLRKAFLPPRLRSTTYTEKKPISATIPKPLMTKLQVDNGVTTTAKKMPNSDESNNHNCYNKTTVMIRNLPNQFSREGFMLFVDHYCRLNHWDYDFLYLPIDFRTKNNMGYAFVNFTSRSAALKIGKILNNFKWEGIKTPTGIYASKKICRVNWARIQGQELLVKHFSKSSFMCETDEYLPVVFSPPRNGSTSMTNPTTIAKLAGPAVNFLKDDN